MARTTLTMKTLTHSPKSRERGNLDDVEGRRVLDLFEKFCLTAHPDRVVDHDKRHYFRIDRDSVHRYGRMVLVDLESGLYGNPGVTRKVTSHKKTHSRDWDEAANFDSRLGFVVPPGGAEGLFLVEREGVPVAGHRIIDLFRQALMASFGGTSYFPVETVTAAEEWLELAAMSSIEIRRRHWKATLTGEAEINDGGVIGRLSHKLSPLHGESAFSPKIRDAVMTRRVDPRDILSFGENMGDPDDYEAIVELTRDGQKKSFVLGHERTPQLQVQLTEGAERRLPRETIRDRMFSQARDYYHRVGIDWNETWTRDSLGVDEDDWDHEYQDAKAPTDE